MENKLPQSGWRARSVVCGYFASTAMLTVLMVSYAFLLVVAATNTDWARQLTDNTLTVAAHNFPYLAIFFHFLAGTGFALLYGGYAENRLSGPAWLKGLKFSAGLYALSIMALSAATMMWRFDPGPAALLGNLVLHIVYGLTLGMLFQGLARAERVLDGGLEVKASARKGSYGLVGGAVAGTMFAALALWIAGSDGHAMTNFPDSWVHLAGALTGSGLGCLLGLLQGEDRETTIVRRAALSL